MLVKKNFVRKWQNAHYFHFDTEFSLNSKQRMVDEKAEGNLQSFPTLPNNSKNGSITISIFTHVITDEEIITVLLFDTSSLM